MICGIIAQSVGSDCNVVVLAAKNNFQEPVSAHVYHEGDIFQLISEPGFDGFIYDQNAFANSSIQNELDSLLKRTGKPVMLLDAGDHPFFENTVSHDPEEFAMLVEHMIQVHGHRKIYCLTGTKGTAQAEDRLEAYFHVMQRHGLDYDESCYFYGDFWRDAPVEYARRIISGELDMPEAVVCANDVMADSLIAEFQKAGIRVPQDVAVTGFDGCLAPDDAISDVSLTSSPHSFYQLGSDAFRRLYTIITGRTCRRAPAKHSKIQIGQSCGCAPVQHTDGKTRREKRLLSRYREWFNHSEVLFEFMHTSSLFELLCLIASRIYLVCHWEHLRIFLTEELLSTVQPDMKRPVQKNMCEVMWIDRAGKGTGICETPMNQSDIISYLTQNEEHPSAFFLSPLHVDERQFGIAALSFGRLPCCYQQEFCTFISYLSLALERLEERSRLRTISEGSENDAENPQLFRQLDQLRQEMKKRPENDWSVPEFCKRTNVSRSYLQRMYKQYFGKSIFEELIEFRLEKAKELLAATNLTMSRISELCGYASYSHFAKQFKTSEGVTLSEYRERCRKE
jgi:DNA-binding LacI/PurR family transcriptional regulator/AraC-like DNA-binding protein